MRLAGPVQRRFLPQGVGDDVFVGANTTFPFSTIVFTSWDYHLTDATAARNLRNTVRNQLAEMLFDAALADAYVSRAQRIGSLALKVFAPSHLCNTLVAGATLATAALAM